MTRTNLKKIIKIPFFSARWGLMTLTTVGYDLNPKTMLGKLVGGFCALSGVFILTLPIPIVVNRWAYNRIG